MKEWIWGMWVAVAVGVAATAANVAPPREWMNKINSYDWLYSFQKEGEKYSPAIGNGYLATVVGQQGIYAAGVYNGNMTDEWNPSHRARIPSTINIDLISINGEPVKQTVTALDMESGVYYLRHDARVEQKMYVHRRRKEVIVHSLRALRDEQVKVCVRSSPGRSADINFTEFSRSSSAAVYRGWTQLTEWETVGKIQVTVATWEPPASTSTLSITGEIRSWEHCVTLDKNAPFTTYSVIQDSVDPDSVRKTYDSLVQVEEADAMQEHVEEWGKLRKLGASVRIAGSAEVAKAVNASVYELLISMRSDVFWSNSPGGLATNHYNGHIFWDFETWMFPALLVMYPELARSGLMYRLNHIEGARKKARDNKYLGSMWPWESAYTGDETTPTFANTGKMEHHISGDVIFAAQQYDHLHRDSKLRSEVLCPLAVETAEYWATRVQQDAKGAYHIIGVIPPDEYVENVTDSVYTNQIAKISLLFANTCKANKTWVDIANGLHIEYDPKYDYHPEYVGYKRGQAVKQADVTLVEFPLGQRSNHSTAVNDLNYYSKVTDYNGPAMTWSMFFIQSLELAQNRSEVGKAMFKYFFKSFLINMKGPFCVWWEAPEVGATHFATGAGGFLQGIVLGFGGVRIRFDPDDRSVLGSLKPFVPVRPVQEVEIRGINLLGGTVRLDVLLRSDPEATFVRSDARGVKLVSRKCGEITLAQGEYIEVPSNIGLEERDGFVIVLGNFSPGLLCGPSLFLLLLILLL